MTSLMVQTITEVATFVISVGASAFIAGMRWGIVSRDLSNMGNRLSKIEGMFEMKLKEHN